MDGCPIAIIWIARIWAPPLTLFFSFLVHCSSGQKEGTFHVRFFMFSPKIKMTMTQSLAEIQISIKWKGKKFRNESKYNTNLPRTNPDVTKPIGHLKDCRFAGSSGICSFHIPDCCCVKYDSIKCWGMCGRSSSSDLHAESFLVWITKVCFNRKTNKIK